MNCLRELEPRIGQLEEKIELYWDGVKKMDELAWADLQGEKKILEECQDFVKGLEGRIDEIHDQI